MTPEQRSSREEQDQYDMGRQAYKDGRYLSREAPASFERGWKNAHYEAKRGWRND